MSALADLGARILRNRRPVRAPVWLQSIGDRDIPLPMVELRLQQP